MENGRCVEKKRHGIARLTLTVSIPSAHNGLCPSLDHRLDNLSAKLFTRDLTRPRIVGVLEECSSADSRDQGVWQAGAPITIS